MALIFTDTWPHPYTTIEERNIYTSYDNLDDEFSSFLTGLSINTADKEDKILSNSEGYEFTIQDIVEADTSQQIINYDNYKEEPIDDFYTAFWNKNKQSLVIDATVLNTPFSEKELKDKFYDYLKQAIIACFEEQEANQTDSYFFYIKLFDILKKLGSILKIAENQTNFSKTVFDDDDFIIQILNNLKMREFSEEEQLELSQAVAGTEVQKTKELLDNRTPMISVNKIQEFSLIPSSENNSEIPVRYEFKYHEIQYQGREMTNHVYKILITGPVGTAFLINHEPKLFYITEHLNPLSSNILEGKFELDTEGYIPIEYITFPAETVPELTSYGKVSDEGNVYYISNEENISRRKTIDIGEDGYNITITVYYEE